MKKHNSVILYAAFAVLMAVLGASDALRGVFAPIFRTHFSLTMPQVSLIMTVSYIGNSVFLFFGGKLLDRLPRKTVMMALVFVWLTAVACFAFTDSYAILLAAIFFAMGASTLLSTAVGLTTPLLFAASPGMKVNVLFFVQCIGTVSSQGGVGSYAKNVGDWHAVNAVLLAVGAASAGVMLCCGFPGGKPFPGRRQKVKPDVFFVLMLLIFSTYFVAEHGVMNWLVSYSMSEFSMPESSAAKFTAIFYGGIMVGRLLFSPLTDRLGVFRCMKLFAVLAVCVYTVGILMGENGLWVVSASGIFFSVLYPTLVYSVSVLWPPEVSSGVCGTLLSIASLADIGFNFGFGHLVDLAGFRLSFLIMPAAMAACTVLLIVLHAKTAARSARSEQNP